MYTQEKYGLMQRAIRLVASAPDERGRASSDLCYCWSAGPTLCPLFRTGRSLSVLLASAAQKVAIRGQLASIFRVMGSRNGSFPFSGNVRRCGTPFFRADLAHFSVLFFSLTRLSHLTRHQI